MRQTKTEMMIGVTDVESSKLIANNTLEILKTDGTQVIRFHETDIITVAPNGNVTLNTGGWFTYTTRMRMRGYILKYVDGLVLAQKSGRWMLLSRDGTEYQYYDGIVLSPDGGVLSDLKTDNSEAIEYLKRRISRFVSKLDRLEALPMPGAGDCWDCCMVDEEGRTMGDLHGSDHLDKHMKEGYLHGSLIVNALREKHGNENFIGIVFSSPEQFKWHRKTVKRCLSRYLFDKLFPRVMNQ